MEATAYFDGVHFFENDWKEKFTEDWYKVNPPSNIYDYLEGNCHRGFAYLENKTISICDNADDDCNVPTFMIEIGNHSFKQTFYVISFINLIQLLKFMQINLKELYIQIDRCGYNHKV